MIAFCCSAWKPIVFLAKVAPCCTDIVGVLDDKEMQKGQKIYHVVSDTFSIMTQTSLARAKLGQATQMTKLALSATAVAADINQKVVHFSEKEDPLKTGDYMDLGAGTLVSVSGFVNDTIDLKPQLFGSHKVTIGNGANFASAVGALVENRALLYRQWRRLRGQPPPGLAELWRRHINLTPEDAESFYRMKLAQTIDELEEIPPLFHEDQILTQFRCALSGLTIRHLLVVAGTEANPHPVWFESRAILQRIQTGERPAQWPEGIAFTRENLHELPDRQRQIDTELNTLLQGIHNSELRFQPLGNVNQREAQNSVVMLALLKTLGLERINTMQDTEIGDAVRANVSPNTIANIEVNTELQQFHAGEQPKLTKVIRFTPTVSLLSKPPLSEEALFAATRAALFTQSPAQDRKALVLAQIPFELRISTDFQDVTIRSELVRSVYERKTELLNMMKIVLQLQHLQGLTDEELSIRTLARIPRNLVHVDVRSLAYRFASAPEEQKPTKAFVFVPTTRRTGGLESSTDSLFAAARALFGSQSEIDKQELKKCHTFVMYVDTDFDDIEIKENL